jgi:hypothetical protein
MANDPQKQQILQGQPMAMDEVYKGIDFNEPLIEEE